MRVLSVQMRDFRAYARAEASLGEGLTVVHGPNGAGKSTLLEALYYGCTGRSHRTRNERELIRFGAQTTRVVVQLASADEPHELSVGFGAYPGKPRAIKRMTADGAPVERLLDATHRPLVGVFAPDRLELVKGPAGVRRAHLDQVVAAIWPGRAEDRRAYARSLAQRNALLGRIRSRRVSTAALGAWDRELARNGLALHTNRAAAVELLCEQFADHATRLGFPAAASLRYRPGSSADSEDEFVAELGARLERDVERGYSAYGPHRDELAILADERELRVYGSQGEQRLLLLALLLAERSVLADHRGRTPLLLLDDVMSELDQERRQMLAEELRAGGQSLIATTDLGQVPGAADGSVTRLRVGGGTVLREAMAA